MSSQSSNGEKPTALASVNDRIRQSRNLFVTMVAACGFCILTAAGITDGQLLVDSGQSQLPLIGVGISTRGFYTLGPILLLAFFIYLHIYLQHTWESLASLSPPDHSEPVDESRLFPWIPALTLFRERDTRETDTPRTPIFIRAAVVFLLYYAMPATVFCMWGRAIAAHHVGMTFTHGLTAFVAVTHAANRHYAMRATLRANTLRAVSIRGPAIATAVFALFSAVPYYRAYLPRLFFYRPFVDARHEDLSTRPGFAVGARLARAGGGCNLYAARFINAKLENTTFERCKVEAVDFSGAHMANSQFRRVDMTKTPTVALGYGSKETTIFRSSFWQADLSNAAFVDVPLEWVTFLDANIDHGRFHAVSMTDVDFTGATLRCAQFHDVSFVDVEFPDADLRGASFDGSTFEGTADFRGAKLDGADFSGATFNTRPKFDEHGLRTTNFRGAKFRTPAIKRSIPAEAWLDIPTTITCDPDLNPAPAPSSAQSASAPS